MQTLNKERDSYFDNLKTLMIILVVLGHVLISVWDVRGVKTVYYFVYSFHMPVFVFLSGCFSKSSYQNGIFRFEKVFQFITLYLSFRLLWSLIEWFFTREFELKLFRGGTTPWYILALSIWLLCIPMLNEIQPRKFMILSIVVAVFAGHISAIGNAFAVSRVLVFFPFFALGYYSKLDTVKKVAQSWAGKRWIAVVIFLGLFVLIGVSARRYPILFEDLLGNLPYSRVYADYTINVITPLLIRLFWYIFRFFLLYIVLIITPGRKGKITFIGAKTLQIYVVHVLIRNIMDHLHFFSYVQEQKAFIAWLLVIGTTVFLTIIPCIPVVSLIFQKLDMLKGVYTRAFRNKRGIKSK